MSDNTTATFGHLVTWRRYPTCPASYHYTQSELDAAKREAEAVGIERAAQASESFDKAYGSIIATRIRTMLETTRDKDMK